MKISVRDYYLPTPAKIRKIADAILAGTTFISSSSMIMDLKTLAVAALIAGALAKFLSNFFTDNDNDSHSQ